MQVAFLGLGRMGVRMAAQVLGAGHDLVVWNRTAGRADDLVARGARNAGSPADAVVGADAIVTMLFGPDAVRAVLAEAMPAAAPGTLVVESSTVGPDVARELAAAATARGLRFVDGPVVGSIGPAADGTLGVLVGGADADVAAATPLLHLWGDPAKVRHVGPVGAGSAAKLVVNLTLGVVMGAIGEAMRLGTRLGLGRATVLDSLALGPVAPTVATKQQMLRTGDFRPVGFALDLLAKDLDLCLGADPGLDFTALARDLARRAAAAGHGSADYAALAGFVGGLPEPSEADVR